MEGYITVKEASEILNISVYMVRSMIKRGVINSSVVNQSYVVLEKDVMAIRERQKVKPAVWKPVSQY